MVVMLFGGNRDSEPRQPSSRDTRVMSCCCFSLLLLLLRCCCERSTVLELFVLLAEVWRGAARRGASALLALLCLVCHPAVESGTAAAGHVAET